jgi:hypothetical protein
MMSGKWHSRLMSVAVLGLVSSGCCPPASFFVETTLHPDGSCDRMIWQPREDFLPVEAFQPAWNARWKSIADAPGPPEMPESRARLRKRPYFTARGSFRNPREIPPHYHYHDERAPEVGASELRRSYEQKDYGFLVDHRWSERITNIVTLPDFLAARDELLNLALPSAIDFFQKEYGQSYDLSRLFAFIRSDGRRFLEEGSVLLYDDAVRHRQIWGEPPDPELVIRLAEQVKRLIGLDLFDQKGNVVSEGEVWRRLDAFPREFLIRHVRHRDGTALTRAEADALIQSTQGEPHLAKPDQEREKQLQERTGRFWLRMVGLYGPLAFLFRGGTPGYEFVLRLPGDLIETNGTISRTGQTRWKFTGDQLFPDGYEMKARSLVIDREGQKTTLGRVVIDDADTALKFLELIGDEEPLLAAVRKARATGKSGALKEVEAGSFEQAPRARGLRKMLFNE